MKFISWNVNGIRGAWNHGMPNFLKEHNADIYAFQETKVSEPVSMMELEGYEPYWSFCTRKKGSTECQNCMLRRFISKMEKH